MTGDFRVNPSAIEFPKLKETEENGIIQMRQRKTSLHSQIAYLLAQRIIRGELLPGQNLPDVEDMRAEFGVSRTVLREAVKLLTAKGIVASKPRIGMTVRARRGWSLLDQELLMWRVDAGIDKAFFQDLIGLRRVIEPGIAELAAQQGTDSELEHILTLYKRLEATVDQPDDFVVNDMRFHTMMIEASHNELLQPIRQPIGVAILAIARTTAQVPGSSRAALPIHKAVAESIKTRDSAQAHELMHQLVMEAAHDIDTFLSQLDHQPEKQLLLAEASAGIGDFLAKHLVS